MAVSLIISHYSHLLHKLQFLEIFMPPDTKPETEQDWRRQSSLKFHWVAIFHLPFHLPGFDVIMSLLGAAIKLLYALGHWEAAKLDQWGTWGQGIPPGGTGVGLLCHILLPSQAQSTTTSS